MLGPTMVSILVTPRKLGFPSLRSNLRKAISAYSRPISANSTSPKSSQLRSRIVLEYLNSMETDQRHHCVRGGWEKMLHFASLSRPTRSTIYLHIVGREKGSLSR